MSSLPQYSPQFSRVPCHSYHVQVQWEPDGTGAEGIGSATSRSTPTGIVDQAGASRDHIVGITEVRDLELLESGFVGRDVL